MGVATGVLYADSWTRYRNSRDINASFCHLLYINTNNVINLHHLCVELALDFNFQLSLPGEEHTIRIGVVRRLRKEHQAAAGPGVLERQHIGLPGGERGRIEAPREHPPEVGQVVAA